MPALSFPSSSTPGRPGEGAGRIVNAYARKDGEALVFEAVPGLTAFAESVGEVPRGMLAVGNVVYAAVDGALKRLTLGGTVAPVGILPGNGLVTLARNNRLPVPDVVIVNDIGAFVTNGATVSPYPDNDVGAPNSVSFLDAYFLFTYSDGTFAASELNSTDVSTLSRAKAEARPDGLLRGVVKGRQFMALGPSTTEFWSNVGKSPFPLARDEVVDVGLKGRWAIAGFEEGWDGPVFMVSSDNTVRRWDGYAATIVSPDAVNRAIAGTSLADSLVACCYTFAGNRVFSLTGPGFTWDHYVDSGAWYERESHGRSIWRGRTSVRAFNRWLVGDLYGPHIHQIDAATRTEGGEPLVWSLEGLGPSYARLNDLRLYFSTGQGVEAGESETVRDPKVSVDWSLNGGASWGQPLHRSLGRQGQYRRAIGVTALGTAREQPVRVRVTVSDPIHAQFRGGELRRVASMMGG